MTALFRSYYACGKAVANIVTYSSRGDIGENLSRDAMSATSRQEKRVLTATQRLVVRKERNSIVRALMTMARTP
jgi:hypothetical protein